MEGEDVAVDLFAQATKDIAEAEAMDAMAAEEEDDGEEPEDDFNAAWEVLDLARAIYDKQLSSAEDDEVKLKLADTFIALGDVSLETGLFIRTLPFACAHILSLTFREVRSSYIRLRVRPEAESDPPSFIVTPDCRGALQAQYRPRPYLWQTVRLHLTR